MAVPILFLEDVGCALVTSEQVRAVVCLHERLESMNAGEQADEIVLAPGKTWIALPYGPGSSFK